jgi:hypothetical protein
MYIKDIYAERERERERERLLYALNKDNDLLFFMKYVFIEFFNCDNYKNITSVVKKFVQ